MRTTSLVVLFLLGALLASCGKSEEPNLVEIGDDDTTADDDTATTDDDATDDDAADDDSATVDDDSTADDDSTTDDDTEEVVTCTVADNGDGSYTFSCPDGSTVTWSSGTDGEDGTDGSDGSPGENGLDGSDGTDGADGASCTVTVLPMGCSVIVCGDAMSPPICSGTSCSTEQDGECVMIACEETSSRICPPPAPIVTPSPCVASTDCDDHDPCTTDTCVSGECGYSPAPAVLCDDGNPCTADWCVTDVGCRNQVIVNGTACADSDLCDGTETCQSGVCAAGTTVVCAAEDVCHLAGECNSATGMCSSPSAPAGITCDDGNAETSEDQCSGTGECEGRILPPPSPDTDGDGYTVAEGDCDDSVVDMSSPARWCRGTDAKKFLVIQFLVVASAPACPAGSVEVALSDGSAINNPGMHDTAGDNFDNDCDGTLDEGGVDQCAWTAIPGVDYGYRVSCPWMNP